mmetsp:Transcript_13140/g.28360  ORF Transcript_13140/g.28360 Transcript_13140/m.28360 type:complete len:266 (-) Transcript_13140:721-1518(-)
MDGTTRIQVGLGTSHLHRDAEALHHFVTAHSEDVNSDHLLVEAGADYLHKGFGFLIGFDGEYSVVEVGEFRGVDFDGVFAVKFDGFWFGDSAGSNGRMRKDNCRNILIRNLGNLILLLSTKQTIGQTPPGGNRHGRQFDLTANVSERIYVVHVRILVFVDDDMLFGRDLDTGGFEVEGFGVGDPFCGVGFSSCCHEYDVGSINDISTVQRHILLLSTSIQFHLDNTIRMPMNKHTGLNHLGIQPIANHRIKFPQRLALPHHQMNF